MRKPALLALVGVAALALTIGAPAPSSAPARSARRPFTVVEATISEMRVAMEQGRVTSRQIVTQLSVIHI